jgi:hypothetical protein
MRVGDEEWGSNFFRGKIGQENPRDRSKSRMKGMLYLFLKTSGASIFISVKFLLLMNMNISQKS